MHQISELYEKWNGLVLILAGIYALLLAARVMPVKFGDPEFSEKWHKKYARVMRAGGLIAILAGMSSLLFGFYSE